MSGCMVGPGFVEPKPPLTKGYTSEGDDNLHGIQRIDFNTKIPLDWWRSFRSPALDQVMKLALTDNNNLAAGRARLAQAQEEADAAAGILWPQASFAGTAGRKKYGVALFGRSDTSIPPFSYYTLGPQVTYLLDFAGGERRMVEQQHALAEFQAYRFEGIRLALTGNVMAQALAIASVKAQIAVLKEIIADDRKNLEQAKIARNAGSETLIDILSAQSQLAGDQALLPPLSQQLSIAKHALAILAGKAPADWQIPTFELSSFTLPRDLHLSLPSALVRVRPDIRASEAQLHAATATVGVATADLYPKITLSANTMQEALTPEKLFNVSANTWAFSANLTAPIFNGGTLRAKKRAAEYMYQAALAHYRQVILESFGQVANILQALKHDGEQVDAQQHALTTAQSSLKLARVSYSAGNIGVLQILDADRLYNKARLGLVLAKTRRYQDTALLYLALGGGSFSATLSSEDR